MESWRKFGSGEDIEKLLFTAKDTGKIVSDQ